MKFKINPKPKKTIAPQRTQFDVHLPPQEKQMVYMTMAEAEQDMKERAQLLFDGLEERIRREWLELNMEIREDANERIDMYLETALKGEDGDDGEAPSDERLTELIKPLIPEPVEKIIEKTETIIREQPIVTNEIVEKIVVKEIATPVDSTPIKKQLMAEFEKKLKAFEEKMTAQMRHLQSKTMVGGGMGTIKYFKFTCNDANTAFTLPDIPTQEGNAVFAFYQGQRLHPTDHYTVSGRTINTTFTGETGSFVDGWIIT